MFQVGNTDWMDQTTDAQLRIGESEIPRVQLHI